MSKKISLFLMLFLSNCYLLTVESEDQVSLALKTNLGSNQGSIISLRITSSFNFPNSEVNDHKKWCDEKSSFVFTFYTPQKHPKERIQGVHKEWEFVRDGVTKGRFKILKSDIVLIHQNKKLTPSEIFVAQEEFNTIESSSVVYSNYDRYGRRFVTFSIPCTQLLDPNTKLIIKRIYKDDKVIKKDIEFSFIKSKRNQGYSIWLE